MINIWHIKGFTNIHKVLGLIKAPEPGYDGPLFNPSTWGAGESVQHYPHLYRKLKSQQVCALTVRGAVEKNLNSRFAS